VNGGGGLRFKYPRHSLRDLFSLSEFKVQGRRSGSDGFNVQGWGAAMFIRFINFMNLIYLMDVVGSLLL